MSEPVLSIDERPVSARQLVDLTRRNGQIHSILQELILDHFLKDTELNIEEQQQLLLEFKQKHILEQDEAYCAFLQQRMLDEPLLLRMLCRPHQVVNYREERWGPRANSLYLQRKERYDQIRYQRLEASNTDVMQEVYFRLKDGEESWESLARQMQPNNPSPTALIGPIAVGDVEPDILSSLREAGEGKLIQPQLIGSNTVVAELVEVIPSDFNEELRTLILKEAFEEWLSDECSRMLQKVRFEA